MPVPDPRPPAAPGAAVATGHPAAAEAALTMLAAGGSAVDAAIAADAVMGVVEPMATGLGGDLAAMLLPPGEAPLTYNGTGRAPAALRAAMVEALPGRRIPERHPLSVTVPGAVQGWADLHARFGRLDFARLLAPAIRLARAGFAVGPVCAREWALFADVVRGDPGSHAIYRGDAIPAAGAHFANPALARLLEEIAAAGPSAFYEGTASAAIARAARQAGALLDEGDLAAHQGNFDLPIRRAFRGLKILECPPNSHGLGVLDALGRLEGEALPMEDPETTVKIVEATRDGMREARRVVADPAGNTVCTAIIDAQGFAVTLMSSIFKRFGSGIGVPELGICLQNRGHGFSAPGHVNGAAPGKRPYHTVIPAAALKDGRTHAVFGVVGGPMQPQGHVQLITRIAAWGQGVQAAIDAPRWRLERDDAVALEPGTAPGIAPALARAGFRDGAGAGDMAGRNDYGGAQMVMRRPDGGLVAGSDRRKDGIAQLG
ncbi:gamma-glutamyltransferase family protein [Mangrovicoccus algicola]|uniref:Gamma-glutamyltransferase n=1 Tax=Mangrovicoccus algicola TaxID=2771008 RepID=A0A8J6YYA5_9RHOB|nr:gamma-glutamyltransferase [Mangrovicoccus algicola]MBE3638166.1 gamma-glutamyltransferase [Mangrovicoccus algicola]